MPSRDDLRIATGNFFDLHWGLDLDFPEWDFSWKFVGPVPNYLFGGLYALFSDEKLLYVGLGASRGGGIYQDRGISRRLLAHVLKPASHDEYMDYKLNDRWNEAGANSVATLGFPAEYNYLAPALEDYLIGRLNPIENKMKKK